jgi:hypothetical protein
LEFGTPKQEALSDEELELTLDVMGLPLGQTTPQFKVQRVGNEWRFAGDYHP